MENRSKDEELKALQEEEDASDEEYEEAEATENPAPESGDVKDNPHNTRRNHLITLLWVCLMAAALIAVDYLGLTVQKKPLDGFMDVVTHEEMSGPAYSAEKQYYTIAENGKYEKIDPFEAEETQVFTTDIYKYEPGSGRGNFLAEYRLYDLYTGKEAEMTPVFMRILELVEETETEHWIFRARILCVRDQYFVCVDRNVNLWSPYVLYYYSAAQDGLVKLATFDGELPTEIRLSEDFYMRVGG